MRDWQPLSVAMAWVVTRDEQFCAGLPSGDPSLKNLCFAYLRLEDVMIEGGCLSAVNERDVIVHRHVAGSTARFEALAQDFERARQGSIRELQYFSNYLEHRWTSAFAEIMGHIANRRMCGSGTAVTEESCERMDLPPSSFSGRVTFDERGRVWEGPAFVGGKRRRYWVDIQLRWPGSLTICQPLPETKIPDSERRAPGPISMSKLVMDIDRQLYPDSQLEGILVKERLAEINLELKRQERKPISEKSFLRYRVKHPRM